jgi:hypothetical protein
MRLAPVSYAVTALLSVTWNLQAQVPYLQRASSADLGMSVSRNLTNFSPDSSSAIDSPATIANLSSNELPEAPQPQSGAQQTLRQIPSSLDSATLSGMVLDTSGAIVVGASVTLSTKDGTEQRSTTSQEGGTFTFRQLPFGSYVVSVQARGFTPFRAEAVVLARRQSYNMPTVVLTIAGATSEVTVRPTEQVAAEQLRAEEKQRVLGIIPSFFTSYVYDAAPLTAKQKFSLTAHETFDPVSLIGVGMVAGIQQANNTYPGYGQGTAGYGKRFGAALGDSLTSDFLGHAVFPSLLHQDPRYFYQGTGTVKSRFYHAVSFGVLTRSDSGHLTPNLSYLLGDLGSGALSNLYYPHADRSAGLVFTNAAIGVGGRAAGAVFREFISKRITKNVPANGTP